MTFAELLDAARDGYCARLREAVARAQREAAREQVLIEPAGRKADGSLLRAGFFATPRRGDVLVLTRADGKREITAPPADPGAPLRFEWNGVPVALGPLRWEACRLVLEGVGAQHDFRPLTSWYAAWFDEHDDHPVLGDGLRGVVHALGDPIFDALGLHLELDLGSSTVDAFEHLLDALAKLKAKTVKIGS